MNFLQRLEFLGDSVLDLLITWHLYQSHTEIDPGKLTDLRGAAVSNENFAQAAVRKNIQPHLRHCSGLLLCQIADYVRSLTESTRTLEEPKCPKVSSYTAYFCFLFNELHYLSKKYKNLTHAICIIYLKIYFLQIVVVRASMCKPDIHCWPNI